MKKYLYILLLMTGCAGEGKYTEPVEDFLSEDEETIELIHHLDSVMLNSAKELKNIDETIVAVENTAKREKKIKKELQTTKKELKKAKKELKKVKKELVSLQKIAGKRGFVKKILKIPVDSVEVSKVENKI
jgi:peptidoglycan hydrolase CwlO-like protein